MSAGSIVWPISLDDVRAATGGSRPTCNRPVVRHYPDLDAHVGAAFAFSPSTRTINDQLVQIRNGPVVHDALTEPSGAGA